MPFTTKFRKIASDKLGVSEPNPSWFGNKPNELLNASWTNKNWLKSRFHFSFAEYSNPRNNGFGVLRVLNDDLVQPLRGSVTCMMIPRGQDFSVVSILSGFGEHPHSNAEICTYVVDGALTHKDSMGTSETIKRGAIQFMTAGSGIAHSEHNKHSSNPLRFIQIWINPKQRGLTPNYGSFQGTARDRRNQWSHLVSDTQSSAVTPIKINQDANIHVAEVFPGHSLSFELLTGRQAYLLCVEGDGRVDGDESLDPLERRLVRHDAAELFGPFTFTVTPSEGSTAHVHFLMVEMKFTGLGRTDL